MFDSDLYQDSFMEAMDSLMEGVSGSLFAGVSVVPPVVSPFGLRSCVAPRVAFGWRAGCVASVRFEVVLVSGAVVSHVVPVGSLRAACFRASAFCGGRGVLRCSAFLSSGAWVCSVLS